MVTPLPDDAGFDELFDAWRSASADFIDLVTPLSQEEWDCPTALPGWTVGDVVAHVSWLEGVLVGEMDEPHEPDWDSLPHAVTDFGRLTEIPVDLRRRWPREAVLVELADMTARREVALASGTHDVDGEVPGPFGPTPLGRVLRMRTLDTWVHEQDIRAALGRPGHLDSPGAQSTAALLLAGLPKVWGKLSGAEAGEVLHLRISGPELEASRVVTVSADGRARMVADDLVDQGGPAVVSLTMTWATYLALACGRGETTESRRHVAVEGDASRASTVLENFCVLF